MNPRQLLVNQFVETSKKYGIVKKGSKQLGTVSVMTYNLHYWISVDQKLTLVELIDMIGKSGADVVCLQEVGFGLTTLKKEHGMDMPYSDICFMMQKYGYIFHADSVAFHWEGPFGNAIFSKIPIVNKYEFRLPKGQKPNDIKYWNNIPIMGAFEGRTAIGVTLSDPRVNEDFLIVTTHLDVTDEAQVGTMKEVTRTKQLQYLLDQIDGLEGISFQNRLKKGLLLCGDFNCYKVEDYTYQQAMELTNSDKQRGIEPDFKTLSLLDTHFSTVFQYQKEPEFPLTTTWSMRVIDHFFVPKEMTQKVTGKEMYCNTLSDHYALVIHMKMN